MREERRRGGESGDCGREGVEGGERGFSEGKVGENLGWEGRRYEG